MTSVMFVCLGNICRSPMAEAVFKDYVKKFNHFGTIESSGTAGYHVGETPDSRSVKTCKKHGVPVDHRAQQFKREQLDQFDWVLVMDESNLENVKRLMTGKHHKAQIKLFGEFDPQGERIIEDPYYGGLDGFEHNFQQVLRCSQGFCKHLGLE